MKNGKVATAAQSMKISDKAGKKGEDWGSGSNLTEGVSARESISVKDMYAPNEGTNRMPKGHDRI